MAVRWKGPLAMNQWFKVFLGLPTGPLLPCLAMFQRESLPPNQPDLWFSCGVVAIQRQPGTFSHKGDLFAVASGQPGGARQPSADLFRARSHTVFSQFMLSVLPGVL